MAIDSSRKLGPGFRFHPTDEELVRFYLKRKVTGKLLRFDYIAVVDVYKFEPWDLPCKSKIKTRDLEWYFFSVLDRKYGNGSRTNRATEHGYWKTTGKDREVKHGDRTVGMKKTLVYHRGRAPRGARTNWVMHEYKLVDEQLAQAGVVQDAFVLCRVFEKSGAGPKNGEKYGAPLNEEEWDVDDHDEEHEEKVPKESDDVGYVEKDDLDEKLVPSGTVGGAGFSPSNFFPGESSRQPEHSQAIIKQDLKPQEVHEISKPQNGQPSDMSEQYGVVGYSVIGDNDVPFDQDPFMGLEDLDMGLNDHELYMCLNDLDQSLDFNENLPSFDDGYLETNDLGFQNCGNHTEGDPSGNDMINEYLACSDDDIYKYLSFDSPMHTESENSVPNQGSSLTQQNAEGETTDMSVASKPEAQSGKAISSEQQNPQESKLVSGNTNPFVKQANKWLASIPAAPAFAAEFPTKEIALGLHPGAQSSNSAHITTGMISITDITLRGNAMDWTMGKNGGFNTIISAGFSQPNFDSAAMMPVSGLVSSKTAFVLSHGWIFVMGFSVLVLSMSFKIGSIMYSGK